MQDSHRRRISDEELRHIIALGELLDQRKDRARARIGGDTDRSWCFAFVGISTDVGHYTIAPVVQFHSVQEPPEETELLRALKTPSLFGSMGRYCAGITHELRVSSAEEWSSKAADHLAWWTISALRVKSLAEFLVPAVADRSWSTISAYDHNEVQARLLEDVPHARRTDATMQVTSADFAWVTAHFIAFANLQKVPRFKLAVDALTTYQHLGNERMMVASLWSGIESLVGVEHEIRFRVALFVASLLAPRGPSRLQCYRRILLLYDERSKAVHGGRIDNSKLRNHLVEVRRILSGLICTLAERGRLLEKDEFESALLE